MAFRVGIGSDIHRLITGRPLILGNIEIPFNKGCSGHSDGDALIHALVDALLGAANLRDIGYHFPDNDPENKDRSSADFLRKTMAMLTKEGWQIGNIDTIISIEQPKLRDHIPAIKEQLARLTGIEPGKISIKAKTAEKMGFVGEGMGVHVQAIALIEK